MPICEHIRGSIGASSEDFRRPPLECFHRVRVVGRDAREVTPQKIVIAISRRRLFHELDYRG